MSYLTNYQAWSVIAGETPTATKWNYLGGNDGQFNTDITRLFQGKKGIETLSDGATITINANSNYNIFQVTLGGNRALAISNMAIGQSVMLRIIQDGVGSRTITSWFSGSTVKWSGGTAPSLSTAPEKLDAFLIVCVASDTYEIYFAGFGLSS
jgi:hypothetical protein